MPVAEIEALGEGSKDAQTQAAISACIATEVRGGRDQDQAVAMCHQMARDKTGGKPAAPGGGG